MKKYLFVLLLLAIFSCDRKTDFEKKLIKSKWVLFKGKTLNEEIDKWPNSYIIFKEDGITKNIYMYSDQEEMSINDDGSERLDPFLWAYNYDNKELIINEINLKVLSIEADTIHLLSDTTNIMLYNIDKTHTKLKKGPGRCLGG